LGAFCLMLSTVLIGGGFVFCSWLEVVSSKWSTREGPKIPTALYPFSILVVWDLLAFFYLYSEGVMRLPGEQVGVIWLSVLTGGLGFLWATRVMVRRNSGPGRSLVAIGSQILVVTSPLCFVVMILGMLILWNRGRI